MADATPGMIFTDILQNKRPKAVAWVGGNMQNPQLSGLVQFFETPYEGVLVEAEIFGLPNRSEKGSSDFYAMHIHQNGDCSAQFTKTGVHFNPMNEPHPEHAGDMIPLMGNQGYAWMAFYDKRFKIDRKIFERFYRLDGARSRDGSYGLGLSIAESIVRQTGGRIWAEGAKQENRFFIELPLCKPAP